MIDRIAIDWPDWPDCARGHAFGSSHRPSSVWRAVHQPGCEDWRSAGARRRNHSAGRKFASDSLPVACAAAPLVIRLIGPLLAAAAAAAAAPEASVDASFSASIQCTVSLYFRLSSNPALMNDCPVSSCDFSKDILSTPTAAATASYCLASHLLIRDYRTGKI